MVSQYLTVAELFEMPLGVEWRNIPQSQPATAGTATMLENYKQITNLIIRASSMADIYCNQVLTATLDAEEQSTDGYTCGIDNEGYLRVHTYFWPIISMQSFQFAYPQLGGTQWQVVTVGDLFVTGDMQDMVVYPGWFFRRGTPEMRVQYTYLNGYSNTMLTGPVSAAAAALPVKDATGMVAGQYLTVYDGSSTEVVQVASSWTPVLGPASVQLATGTQFAHTPVLTPVAPNQQYDISVSAVPPEVKAAVGFICKHLAEQRGAQAVATSVAARVVRAAGSGGGARSQSELPGHVCEILDKYARIV